jgi:hypothetical protein
MRHFVIEGANFSGAVDQYGQPVPNSAAEIIFTNISEQGFIDIMNPNIYNISFALEIERSNWDGPSLTAMVQSLGTDVGVDHINCSICTVTEVPYIWDIGGGPGVTEFTQLLDVPHSYAGAGGYAVTVNPGQTGLIFTPIPVSFGAVAVNAQSTVNASIPDDTLSLIPGSNVSILTDPITKSITISADSGSVDYIPVPPGTHLQISKRYFVTAAGTVYLPVAQGSGYTAGQSIRITKPAGNLPPTYPTTVVFVTVGNPVTDLIATDLGSDTTVEFDATQEIVLVFDGDHTWELQIGSVNS